ncbi:MAG TPA: transglycosylase SLT domain-containing protein [Solirubrobacteraceae bacterium]|nr:transglycosylase SLT domain-containing protein [Solirubrobacteraceae bacterium]
MQPVSRRRRPPRRPGRIGAGLRTPRLVLLLAAAVLAIAVIVAQTQRGDVVRVPLPGIGRPARAGDPFGYIPSRESAFVARATAGSAQVLFTKSPGGVMATAARVAAYRPLIDAATRGSGIDPNVLEGIVFVESAGRPYVVAGPDATDAAGLTQILAETGQSLLGMHIDLPQSRKLLRAIGNAGSPGQVTVLLRRLARADDRFDPAKALAATVRYLQTAQRHFGGRADLAVVSYHMGIGNLEHVLSEYDGGHSVPYAQLYFDTAPDHNSGAFRLLSGFGDQSSLYYWRVLGAVQVMRLYRSDRAALARLTALQISRESTSAVLHPPDRTPAFSDPATISAAYARRALVRLPANSARLGLAYSPSIGALAHRLGVPPGLYLGLRPAALDLLVELAARVQALSGAHAPLIVTSAVTDARYQRQAGSSDPDSDTGFSFEIARTYASRAQAAAFQSMLDRLQALNLIAWERQLATIKVTVAADASRVIVDGP